MASECRSCGAPVIWVKTKAGKNMPVDYATFNPGDRPVYDADKGHISHFATCPDADKHRKPRD